MKRIGIIILIVLLGVILRLVALDKAEGLWNDEYVSYMISARPLGHAFVEGIKSQCHMPFYYLYLKSVMALFGESDLVLRLSSVAAGVLSIITMYFVGKERNERTGIYCAAFSAISSFLIYYSQEVRLYSVLFFFSALMLLFTIKLVKNPDVKNLLLFALSSFLVLFTHTIGFVFVFFMLVYISCKLFNSHKNIILKMWGAILIITLLLTPQIIGILFRKSFSQWWGSFSPSALGFLITDYFSPVITNFTGAPANFFYNFKSGFIIFAMIPSVIAFWFVLYSLKDRDNRKFLYVVIATLAVIVTASMSGKLVFITKYTIEIYPILILLLCAGADSVKNNVLRNTGITIFCVLSLFFLLVSPLAANRLPRKEGHKLAADLIKSSGLKTDDAVILQYYDKGRFTKYYDFTGLNVISMNKGNFAEYIQPDVSYAQAFSNGKKEFQNAFAGAENNYFENKILENLKPHKNQKVVVISLNSVSFFNEETLKKIAGNETYYSQVPLFFLVFSYLKNETADVLSRNYTLTGIHKSGEWIAMEFTKLNN